MALYCCTLGQSLGFRTGFRKPVGDVTMTLSIFLCSQWYTPRLDIAPCRLILSDKVFYFPVFADRLETSRAPTWRVKERQARLDATLRQSFWRRRRKSWWIRVSQWWQSFLLTEQQVQMRWQSESWSTGFSVTSWLPWQWRSLTGSRSSSCLFVCLLSTGSPPFVERN